MNPFFSERSRKRRTIFASHLHMSHKVCNHAGKCDHFSFSFPVVSESIDLMKIFEKVGNKDFSNVNNKINNTLTMETQVSALLKQQHEK